MAATITCICGHDLQLPEGQTDVKCAHCGRVYTYQGRFLWKEAAGNSVPGSSDIEDGGIGLRAEDKVPDPDAADKALEEAFQDGKLPEAPRRRTDEEIAADQAEENAIAVLEQDRQSRRGKK